MKKDNLRQDIEKLIFILHGDPREPFVTKEYMIEKLTKILNGNIRFHDTIENYFKEKNEQKTTNIK
jgi:hypothetical protein